MRLDAGAGEAVAMAVELPAGQPGGQVRATFFQAGAAAGAEGFEATLGGPLGAWTATPAGHHSFAEHDREQGVFCQPNDSDATCLAKQLGASFGVHPGGAFGSVLRGTWVAPAAGAWLLRIDANCDVPFCAPAC